MFGAVVDISGTAACAWPPAWQCGRPSMQRFARRCRSTAAPHRLRHEPTAGGR